MTSFGSRIRRLLAGGLMLAAALPLGAAAPRARVADTLIRGGTIYTGADAPPFVGDVAIRGDKIVYVGPVSGYRAAHVIDAKGMLVTPGLIDAHSHPDTYIRSADPNQRVNAPWLTQGVSTVMIGVDGYGTPDITKEIGTFEREGIGTNVVPFVGFGAIRSRVMGQADRAPNAEELARMKALVAQGMCQGAVGFSTGLFYAPQSFAKTDEVIELAKEAAKRGGLYDTHQRDESDYTIGVLNSVREVLRIGREAHMPVHFAHLKALGVDVHGYAPRIIALIDQARAEGEDVTADQYPWLASGTSVAAALVPREAHDGGFDAMLKRLDDPAESTSIKAAMRENLRRRGGAASLLFTYPGRSWTGKTLAEMAKAWHMTPIDASIRILHDDDPADPSHKPGYLNRGQAAALASFNMAESDVEDIMRQPWVVTSSDGSDGHPRQYATFPQKYKVYVEQKHVISLADFIRRSTGLTADIYKLDRRGYLKPGYFADVAVIDQKTYAPRADYLHPRVLSVGVRALFVNGVLAVRDSKVTGTRSGRGLLHHPPAGTCPA